MSLQQNITDESCKVKPDMIKKLNFIKCIHCDNGRFDDNINYCQKQVISQIINEFNNDNYNFIQQFLSQFKYDLKQQQFSNTQGDNEEQIKKCIDSLIQLYEYSNKIIQPDKLDQLLLVEQLISKIKKQIDQNQLQTLKYELEKCIPIQIKEPDNFLILLEILEDNNYSIEKKQFTQSIEDANSLLYQLEGVVELYKVYNELKNNQIQNLEKFLKTYSQLKNKSVPPQNNTLLYIAVELADADKAQKETSEAIDMLILAGCNINQENISDKSTPLHAAQKNKKLYQFLRINNAIINKKNKQGIQAVDEDFLINRNALNYWQYQIDQYNLTWEAFDRYNQILLEQAFQNSQEYVSIYINKQLYEINLKQFNISGPGIDYRQIKSIRKISEPPDLQLVKWQYQNINSEKPTKWEKFTNKMKNLVQDSIKNGYIFDIIVQPDGFKQLQIMNLANFSLENNQIINGYIRWIPKLKKKQIYDNEEYEDNFNYKIESNKNQFLNNDSDQTDDDIEDDDQDQCNLQVYKPIDNKKLSIKLQEEHEIAQNFQNDENMIYEIANQIMKNQQLKEQVIEKQVEQRKLQLQDKWIQVDIEVIELIMKYYNQIIEELKIIDVNENPNIIIALKNNQIGIEIQTSSNTQLYKFQTIIQSIFDYFSIYKQQSQVNIKQSLINLKNEYKNANFIKIDNKIKNEFMQLLENKCGEKQKQLIQQFKYTITSKYLENILLSITNKQQAINTLIECVNQQIQNISTIINIKQIIVNIFEILCNQQIQIMKQDLIKKNLQFSDKSNQSLHYFLKQLTDDLNKEQDQDLPNKISNYIFNAILYIKFSSQNLPLFEESKDILNKIKDNNVIIIQTSTGSGKSTLLPPLLVAQGYQNILVSQPRRQLCKLIYNQIKSIYGKHIVGWEASEINEDCHNPLIYLTDELLKERIMYDNKYVDNYSVIILDEIHERSLNMDVIIGLLSYIMSNNNKQLKVIISSATLDQAVKQHFIDLKEIKVAEFVKIFKPKFKVKEIIKQKQSYMNILLEVIKYKKREDQILIFLNTINEIDQATKDFKKLCGGVGYPLFAQQAPSQQMDYLGNGSIFFSTHIAETSLTIEHLKYIIDTRQLNLMYFDYEKDAETVIDTYASKSSVEQRRGRLGRTNDGMYIMTYDDQQKRDLINEFSDPEILRISLLDLEFSLWKQYYLKTQNSQQQGCWKGMKEFYKYLPTKPNLKSIQACQERLKDYEILKKDCSELTDYGKIICKLPFTGQLQLLIAIEYGLNNKCGQDIIQLVCIMVSLQNSANQVLTTLGQQNISKYGHFSSLFNIFHQIINIYENNYKPGCNKYIQIQDIRDYCDQIGVNKINAQIFYKAIILYKRVKTQLMNYKEKDQNQNYMYIYRNKSQESTFNQGAKKVWENLARCLMKGYFYNIFMNLGQVCGDEQCYIRLSKNPNNQIKCYLNNKLYPSKQKPKFLLTCDVSYSPRQKEIAQIDLMGIIKPDWIDFDIIRIIEMQNEQFFCKQFLEQNPNNNYQFIYNDKENNMEIIGKGKQVINIEQKLYAYLINKQLKKSINFKQYLNEYIQKNNYSELQKQQVEINLKEMMNMDIQVFKPLIDSFKSLYQVKAELDRNNLTFYLTGRELYCNCFIKAIEKSMVLIANCKVIRKRHSEVRLQQITHIDNHEQIEQRITKITDIDRTSYDIWESTVGSNATRISRMEVACWVACTQFDCLILGGFIRDWVVGGYKEEKPNIFLKAEDIDDYITCPKDLDIYIPQTKKFLISNFIYTLIKQILDNNQQYQ